MQGKKTFTPQLFVSVNLLDLVPVDNFYRKLLTELDLDFIYKATQKYYGKEGQESVDPVVFFKILLEFYLKNGSCATVTAVSTSPFFSVVFVNVISYLSWCVVLVALLLFIA